MISLPSASWRASQSHPTCPRRARWLPGIPSHTRARREVRVGGYESGLARHFAVRRHRRRPLSLCRSVRRAAPWGSPAPKPTLSASGWTSVGARGDRSEAFRRAPLPPHRRGDTPGRSKSPSAPGGPRPVAIRPRGLTPSRRAPWGGDIRLIRASEHSALSRGQVGWDWLALQLADGSEIMLYRPEAARRRPIIFPATEIRRDGSTRVWPLAEIGFEAPAGSRARRAAPSIPTDGASIPPSGSTSTYGGARRSGARLGFRYWEGRCGSPASKAGHPVMGVAYVELTGYSKGRGTGGRS